MGCSTSSLSKYNEGSRKKSNREKSSPHKKEKGLPTDVAWGLSEPVAPGGQCGQQGSAALLGVVKVCVIGGELQKKANYNVTISIGLQSFLSLTSPKTQQPRFDAERNVVIMRGAHVLHCLVHKLKGSVGNIGALKRKPIGVASIDLLEVFPNIELNDVQSSKEITVDLKKPTYVHMDQRKSNAETTERAEGDDGADDKGDVVGQLTLVIERASLEQLESAFWSGLIELADWDESGALDKEEFQYLMQEILSSDEDDEDAEKLTKDIGYLWQQAEAASGPGKDVDAAALCKVLTEEYHKHGIHVRRCPISGAKLHPTDVTRNLVYILFQMNSGQGKNLQGGFRTAAQANRSWITRLTEWALEPAAGNFANLFSGMKYQPGLNRYSNAAHVVIYDRNEQILVEEVISSLVVLALRNMYQSPLGMLMKATGAYQHLKDVSKQAGSKFDDPASKSYIRKFVKAYKGQLDVAEIEKDLDEYETFNEFFYRKLKPGARPITSPHDDTVFISAADCRLMAFDSEAEAKQFWIKGRLFSLAGLLADEDLGMKYQGCSLLVFRLAPQDYHRFHSPFRGVIRSIHPIPGYLYTVHPIAINSPMVNVFNENKRVRVEIETEEFGNVQYVIIGATAVGSICLSVKEGDTINKGDEIGYFAFGGSTIVTLIPSGHLVLDPDIRYLSKKSVETLVKMGERLGYAKTHIYHADSLHAEQLPGVIIEQAEQISSDATANFRRLAMIHDDAVAPTGSDGGKRSSANRWDILRQSVTKRNKEFLAQLLEPAESLDAEDLAKRVELATQQTVLVEEE